MAKIATTKVSTEAPAPETTQSSTAALEHLTGSARGTVTWLSGPALDVALTENRLLRVTEPSGSGVDEAVIARLHRSQATYEVEARESHPVWVNGNRVSAWQLAPRDLIEFGEEGPMSRFRLYREDSRARKSVAEIVNDCVDYTRTSRRPMGARVSHALRELLSDFTHRTTVLFRLSMVAAIVALTAIALQQGRTNVRLSSQLETDAERIENFATALTRARREALSPADLSELRDELDHSLSSTSERLAALEDRSEASTRIIAAAMQSVVFLQGAYGFRETESNRMLRYATAANGRTLMGPRGQPMLTLEGDGPVAERQFTGTGFVVSQAGALLTNRHVALPWEDDASIKAMGVRGIQPIMVKFIGYLPGHAEPFQVELLEASDEADLAVLLCKDITAGVANLEVADAPPEPGDEVIVMGYPTGLKSMLAQTGSVFIEELRAAEDIGFWSTLR